MTPKPVTCIAYHGSGIDTPLVGGQDPVSSRTLDVLWAGSTLGMAQQFQDGQVRKLEVTLAHPLVLDDLRRRNLYGNLSHARIVDLVREDVESEVASYDGVMFLDTVDGMEVADVIVVFAQEGDDGKPSVDHAVKVIGSITFDEALEEWFETPGFRATTAASDPGTAPNGAAPGKPAALPNDPRIDGTRAANGLSVAENFQAWFEGSTIVNEDGSPRVLFHGTRHDFDAFEPAEDIAGFFFTHDPHYASFIASDDEDEPNGQIVLPVFVSMRAPLDVTEGLCEADANALLDAGADPGVLEWLQHKHSDQWMVFQDSEGGHEFIEVAASASFDGVIFNENEELFAYAVFSPTQVKSAIANSGLYLGNSASMTDQRQAVALHNAREAKVAVETVSSTKRGLAP